MAYVRSFVGHAVAEQPKSSCLQVLCQSPEPEGSATKSSVIPDARFDEISKQLEIDVQKSEWTSRPRTYFILWQIRRVDAMDAFVAAGLNDTSLPYRSRHLLPSALDVNEAERFLQWQNSVVSDTLHLEQGKHVRLNDGDLLFESERRKLGIGSQGSTIVDRVISKATGKTYARKRINRKKTFGHDTMSQKVYENELKTLKKVADHDHLIKVRGTYTDKKYLVMLLQPVADENLKQYMSREPLLSVAEQARFRGYFGCLAHTIRFLHDSTIEILHKDIKPENVLLKDGRLILTDFGTAFDWSKTGQSMTQSNANDFRTPRYQSPEAAVGQFHRSSDIWSLGVVFLEMVTFLRGKTLAEMDTFLQRHGKGVTNIHNNIEGAIQWLEQLQVYDSGSPTDNGPLTWIKAMLNCVQVDRPTAAELFDNVVGFQDGRFCGRCCMDTESSSDDGFESDTDMLSDIEEHDEPAVQLSPEDRQDIHITSRDQTDVRLSSTSASSKTKTGRNGTNSSRYWSPVTDHREPLRPNMSSAWPTTLPMDSTSNSHISNHPCATITSSYQDTSQMTRKISKLAKEPSTPAPQKAATKSKSKVFRERDTFVQWLAYLPEKFASKTTHHQSISTERLSHRGPRAPTVEAQRINHFLSSLPEETTDFDDTHTSFDEFGNVLSLHTPNRSRTMPLASGSLLRSNSQEDLLSSSHLLQEENDTDQFADVGKSRLVHYASDGELNMPYAVPKEALELVIEDLKEFSAALQLPKRQRNQAAELTSLDEQGFQIGPTAGELASSVSVGIKESETRPDKAPATIEDIRGFLGQIAIPKPSAVGDVGRQTSSDSNKNASLVVGTLGSKSSTKPKAPSLGAFIKEAPPRGRRQFESATVIMERILDDKSSEAPTSVMSVNTRAIVLGGRIGLKWNDKAYGYLPKFVANGKVGAVRECLRAGCNPGTKEIPRWAPVYNAVRGKTDRHLKCLRALVEYDADVNAKRFTNGRTLLHYAVESEPWPSYSSVIYTLLVAGADPNLRDAADDLPLLMLLVGNGPLSQEKRDALFLLLAPNFSTNLNVSVPGTLDNPLHLAIRRKDAYTVEAILEKMKQVGGLALHLMNEQNGSGFTPLLLALTIFPLVDDSEEEIQIINYLLRHGADANDTTQGKAPLHLVIGGSKNTIALELLCRHSANPTMLDLSGQSALALVRKLRADYPQDAWYPFAERRMENRLTAEDYRPPELEAFLAEEADNQPAS